MKITKAWPAEEEEEAVRKGLRGYSIRPLKRAKDGDDEWETRLRRRSRDGRDSARDWQETCGGTLWTRAIQKEGGRLGRRLSSVLSTPEGSCLFLRNRAFVARSLEEGTEPVR